jgi:hypothetical protein
MLKVALSALAMTVLLTGLGMSAADAKTKRKPAVVASAATCTAPMWMRDETRFWMCAPKTK